MSVITTKSALMSILKLPSCVARNSLHRVRFELPKDIKKIFLDFKSGCNTRDYENLVCTIRDSEISDEDLLLLLKEAKNCIALLNYDLRLFVQALIIIRWTHRGENVVKCYQELINNLVSAHSQHTKVVIDQLIALFSNSEESEWVDDEPSEYQRRNFDNLHFILQSITEMVPMSEDIVIASLKHHFPYLRVSTHKQVSYLYNMLKMIEYLPDSQVHILQIIVDKLISIDVLAPMEEIQQFEEEPDDMFEMEIDDKHLSKSVQMKHPLGDALDVMMGLVFKYIRNECYEDDKLMMTKCRQLYNELICVFESVIVSTHASHHVQFIIFYICSFDKMLASEFLKYLWKRITSPSIAPIIRETCVAYLASFLARAEYLPLSLLKIYLSNMAKWVHSYISNYEGVKNRPTFFKDHYVFYSICQAIFYLIAFRHQDLVDSKSKLVFLERLNLFKIVTCKLNPLRVCLPVVIEKFAAVTRACQLAYCYTIIENNSRSTMPVFTRGGEIAVNTILNTYFPFDRYILKRTSRYIVTLFREYKSLVCDEVGNTRTNGLKNGAEDDDDFIGEGNVGNSPISCVKKTENHDLSCSME